MDTINIPYLPNLKQSWTVTPGFHAVVGDISKAQFKEVWGVWKKHFEQAGGGKPIYVLPSGDQVFTYVTDKGHMIRHLRDKWAGRNLIFFTNDPLVINELAPEEVTLACRNVDQVVLINFTELDDIEEALKVYKLGEFWVSNAEGGSERRLRFGPPIDRNGA